MGKPKDRTLDPAVEKMIVTARVAGISERRIYESLRDDLKEPPSYRDVRAALAKNGVRYRYQATERRRKGDYPLTVGEKQMRSSKYLEKRAEVRKVDRTPDAEDKLADRFLLGYAARAGLDVDLLDDERFAESLENIYDDEPLYG
jgi:hypothetical protein